MNAVEVVISFLLFIKIVIRFNQNRKDSCLFVNYLLRFSARKYKSGICFHTRNRGRDSLSLQTAETIPIAGKTKIGIGKTIIGIVHPNPMIVFGCYNILITKPVTDARKCRDHSFRTGVRSIRMSDWRPFGF